MSALLTANWNYPTAHLGGPRTHRRAGRRLRSARHQAPAPGDRRRPARRADGVAGQVRWCPGPPCSRTCAAPGGRQYRAGLLAYRGGGHDGVIAFGAARHLMPGKSSPHVRADPPHVGFRGHRDWWTRADERGMRRWSPCDHRGHGVRVGRAGVVITRPRTRKKFIFHPKMMPRRRHQRSGTHHRPARRRHRRHRIDAFVHCFEAYCAPVSIRWPTALRSKACG